MKKLLTTLTLLAASIIFIFTLCSCQESGDDGTKIVYVDKDEKYGYCEHRWETKSQTLPNCTVEGETVMQCRRCGKKQTTKIPTVDCEFKASWEMYNNNSAASLFLTCVNNPLHTHTTNAIITGRSTVKATCRVKGAEIYNLKAIFNGKEFTTVHIVEKSYGRHPGYTKKTVPLGDFCYDGIETIEQCTSCDYVSSKNVSYDHMYEAETRYDLSVYGYCDGYISYQVCVCGCFNKLTIKNTACKTTKKIDEYTVSADGNEIYSRSIEKCEECGLSVITEACHYGVNITPSDSNMTYKKTTVLLSEDVLLGGSVAYNRHSSTEHNVTVETKNLGEACTDGVIVTKTCNDCIYTSKYLTKGHTYTKETTHVENGACGLNVVVERCHCGYVGDIYVNNVTCSLSEITATEHFGTEMESISSAAKAHKCETCGLSYFIGLVLVEGNTDGRFTFLYYVEFCSVKINNETVFEVKSDQHSYGNDIFYDAFIDKDLTDEERQAIEDYFNSLKNQQ